ncbi:MAG: urate hydroxylase PuuD, partial [Planctomycetota bacterium]
KKVNPSLLPRALWWFRWGAMITLLAGLGLFWKVYLSDGLLRDADGGMSDRAMWILLGMLLGSVMWFNVWFIIWPAQKKLIAWTRDGLAPPEQPALARKAYLASRTNTYLSGPMLFGMLAGGAHYPSMQFGALGISVALGALAIYVAIAHSKKVGTTI